MLAASLQFFIDFYPNRHQKVFFETLIVTNNYNPLSRGF